MFRHTDYSYYLETYDGENCTATTIAKMDGVQGYNVTAIAADGEGKLYGIVGGAGQLVTIDKTTGACTTVGSLGIYPSGFNQSAVFDQTTGKLYWASAPSSYATTHCLYEVDLTTGKATKVLDLEKRVNGLYIAPKKADPATPAEVEDLAAQFTGTGTDVKVTFTLPSKNVGGNALSGDLNWSLSVAGAEVDHGSGLPGTAVEKTVTLEAGERELSLTVSQGELTAKAAKATVFAGYDTPTNISNLKSEVDGNSVKLTWDAPTATHEGGMLNQEALSYTVTRNPGATEVATGLKVCEFTDQLPDDFAKFYSWTVTVKYEGADDQSLTSDHVVSGKPYNAPYTQNFDGAESLADVTFGQYNDETGNSRPSPQWEIGELAGNKAAKLGTTYYFNHKDYLFTAPLNLEKGATYTLKYKLGADKASPTSWDYTTQSNVARPFELSVMLTKGMSAAEDAVVTPALKENIEFTTTDDTKEQFIEQEAIVFSVDETGTYNLCFLETGNLMMNNNINLFLDDIELTVEYPTPAPVADFKAEVENVGDRDVKVAFTCPDKDTNGNALIALSKVELYRGSELVKTFTEEAVPGAQVEYTDVDAPRGLHNYKAVAYIHENASTPQSASVRTGYLNNLEIAACSVPEAVAQGEIGQATVTVRNDAFEMALDYTVVLLIDGQEAATATGNPLSPDAEETYEFGLPWEGNEGKTVKVQFEVVFYGDENLDNNKSEEYSLSFAESGIEGIDASGSAAVKAAAGQLHVYNADGQLLRVFALDGRQVASTTVRGAHFTLQLAPGAYVVNVAGKSFKVTL